MNWFSNTLFVITADHTSIGKDPYYLNRAGMYAIPLLFYKPGSGMKGAMHRIVQQSDIMPSVLDYLNYDKPYIAFGNSVFNLSAGMAVNFLNGIYQIFTGEYMLQFDGEKSTGLFHIEKDRMLTQNLLLEKPEIREDMENQVKAVIQSYNFRLIHNRLSVN